MKVVILCGGLGTRLREETEFRPKPMVHIGDRPILWHTMKHFAHYGHKEFVLCLGYKGEQIKDFFRNYHWNTSDVTLHLGESPQPQYHSQHDEEDWTVTLLDTGQTTQTGGRLSRALPFVDAEHFLFAHGDTLSDADLGAAIQFHEKQQPVATVLAVQPPGRCGDLIVAGSRVRQFDEKPSAAPQGTFVNGGLFVLSRNVSDYLTGDDCVFERDVVRRLTEEKKLAAFTHTGFWQCMDTHREQAYLEDLWQSHCAPWKVWTAREP